jgi:predicted transcriptional regulator of viral defense system
MAIDPDGRKPRVDYPPLRVVRYSGKSLTEGVETHRLDGVDVPIYSAAKTVIDCFRYRNKIGVDVAIEALRDAWKSKKATADELWHFAKIGRVSRVVQPYMESATG